MIPYQTENKLRTPALENLHLSGAIAEQMEIFFRERIRSDYAKNVIYRETEEQFRIQDDDKTVVGMWRGEFWGKWVISACRAARYAHDEELKAFLHKAALSLLSLAREDGYLGTYRAPENIFPCDRQKAKAAVGWESDWNWNLWCRKYTLWGLIECYDLSGDEAILRGAARSADQMIAMLERMHVRTRETGTFCGMPSGSILKPMLLLYRRTGEERYLTFARQIADDWERPDGAAPNLITNALSGKPVHTWYPHPEKWAKAYEMMSCFDGILELYRVTGVSRYLTAAERFYEELYAQEQNILFSVGFNDQFANGSACINSLSEPCDIIHWMRLCSELYLLTGNIRYIETLERAYYNPFLAAAFRDGKWGARCVRTAGRPLVATGQASMRYSHCCVNNMPRGFLNACELYAVTDGEKIFCNLYTDYEGTLSAISGSVHVKISGTYLRDGQVKVSVDTAGPCVVCLRIPAWSKKTFLNGRELSVSGCYYECGVPAGHTDFSLAFDMTPVLREFPVEPERFPREDFRVRRFVDGNPVPERVMVWDRRATVLYGPLLLTQSKAVGSTEEEMFDSDTVSGKGFVCQVEPTDADGVRNAFRVTFVRDGQTVTRSMCDLATGANRWSEDDPCFYSVFV